MADPHSASIHVTGTEFSDSKRNYTSFADRFPQTHYFECELAENHGIIPLNHPWLRPVRKQDVILDQQPYTFYRLEGDEVHEVAVGPIHAGVIEPGHFRFLCHGEMVYHLEINLGYQHRGVEKLMTEANDLQRLMITESIAGDTVIGHTLAYAMAMEGLSQTQVSLSAQTIRIIAEELERVAMHLAGLSGIANDIGLAIAAGAYGRLRTLVINSSGQLCGSRFGRGLIVPGGVRFGLREMNIQAIREQLLEVQRDVPMIHDFMFNLTGALARFENTGRVSKEWAEAVGLVGPAARSSGVSVDARHLFPYGAYRYFTLPMILLSSGDVYARARIRAIEMMDSIQFILDQLDNVPDGDLCVTMNPIPPQTGIISITEGWRGEIVHAVFTDDIGHINQYKIKDPSFHNWYGLALALRKQGISDFPLCNKSFDLSYAGHDL
jgi:Ni,Fe-hydrogenase III large subunit